MNALPANETIDVSSVPALEWRARRGLWCNLWSTTFDVSALRARRLVVTSESTFGMEMLGIPKIDVRSVGAGAAAPSPGSTAAACCASARKAPAPARAPPATASAAPRRR